MNHRVKIRPKSSQYCMFALTLAQAEVFCPTTFTYMQKKCIIKLEKVSSLFIIKYSCVRSRALFANQYLERAIATGKLPGSSPDSHTKIEESRPVSLRARLVNFQTFQLANPLCFTSLPLTEQNLFAPLNKDFDVILLPICSFFNMVFPRTLKEA